MWCEIDDGRDFFAFHEPVDWIVSNPPYSDFHRWLVHAFEISENVVYLVPFGKIFKSMNTVRTIYAWGGIVKALCFPARHAGFPFGFPCGAFHFRKGYTGPMEMRVLP